MMVADKALFGQIALSMGLIDEQKLKNLLEQQKLFQPPVPLGQMMLSEGLLDAAQIDEILVAQQSLRQNQPINGYELISKIGSGGVGVVYKARKEGIEKTVALKILAPAHARNRTYIERFFREARSAGQLNHPNIVAGFDVGESNGYYYFAMEYIEGETVKRMLKRRGRIPENEALDIAAQVTEGLAHAHSKGFIHRDIKPDNIIVTPDGQAKLTDLGLAKADTLDSTVTQEGRSISTPAYSSPEQASGATDIDIRSDIYSLGATLYHMIAGKEPFSGHTPAAILAKHITENLPPLFEMKKTFSEPVARLIKKMMAKERDARHVSPTELLKEINAIRHPAQRKAAATPPHKIPTKIDRGKPATAKLIAGAAGIIMTAAILIALLYPGKPSSLPPQPPDTQEQHTPSPPVARKEQVDPDAEARRALQRAIQAEEQDPGRYDALSAEYRKVEETYPGTEVAADARKRRAQLTERREQAGVAALKSAAQEAAEQLQEQRFGRAREIWWRLAQTDLGRDHTEHVLSEIRAIETAARERLAAIIDEAEELATAGKHDEAAAQFAVVFQHFGLADVEELAREKVQHYEKLAQEEQERLAQDKLRENDFRLELHTAVKVLPHFHFDEAAREFDRLEADGPRHMLHLVQILREDAAALRRFRSLLIERINAEPEKLRSVTLDTGRVISVASMAASDAGLALNTPPVEMNVAWDRLSPQWLLTISRSIAADEPLLLAIYSHYAGMHAQTGQFLTAAASVEEQRQQAETLQHRFNESIRFEQIIAITAGLKTTRELIAAGQAGAAARELEQLRAQIERAGLAEHYAADIAAIERENNELQAQSLLDKANREAQNGNWRAVADIIRQLQANFGQTRLVTRTAAREIAALRRDSERLIIDRDMIAAVRHFIVHEDAPARALFNKVIRENEGSLAEDARAFLNAMDSDIALPEGECRDIVSIVYQRPDHLQRLAGLRKAMLHCKGTSSEIRARSLIGMVLRDNLHRPALAREVFLTIPRDFRRSTTQVALAYVAIGKCEEALGNWPAAERNYDTVLRNFANEQDMCALAMRSKAEYHQRAGDLAKAVELLEEAVAKYPGGGDYTSSAQLMLARIYRDQLDRKDDALKALREVYNRTPTHRNYAPSAMIEAAALLAEKGEQHEARDLLRLVIRRFPETRYETTARERLAEM